MLNYGRIVFALVVTFGLFYGVVLLGNTFLSEAFTEADQSQGNQVDPSDIE